MSTRLISLVVLTLFLDFYIYQSLHQIFVDGRGFIVFQVIYSLCVLLNYFSFYKVGQKILDRSLFHGAGVNFHIGFLISSLVSKLTYSLLLMLYDFCRLIFTVFSFNDGFIIPDRMSIVIKVIAVVSLLMIVIMIYGVTWGKLNYKIEKLNLRFSDLPKPFDGFRIVQISDIHAGSYGNNKSLLKGINLINQQNPDLILFTGDLVNDHKNEVNPYIDSLKMLKSK